MWTLVNVLMQYSTRTGDSEVTLVLFSIFFILSFASIDSTLMIYEQKAASRLQYKYLHPHLCPVPDYLFCLLFTSQRNLAKTLNLDRPFCTEL